MSCHEKETHNNHLVEASSVLVAAQTERVIEANNGHLVVAGAGEDFDWDSYRPMVERVRERMRKAGTLKLCNKCGEPYMIIGEQYKCTCGGKGVTKR